MSSFPICQVCYQQFSLRGPEPFLLPCLHSVCETCVTSAAGGVISCSTCQGDVNLTETRLQKDLVTEKETLHLTVKHHPELVLCSNEEDGNQAVCWCKECEDFLCENCQMIHGSFKGTKKHTVHDIGELLPEHMDVDTYCKIHPRHILDVWGEQCGILICRKCKDEIHAEHKTVDFDQAVEKARNNVSEFGEKVQSSFNQQGSLLTTLDTDLQASDETCDNLTMKISLTFNSLKTLIDQREKELQIELQQHHVKVRRVLNEKKNTSETVQKKCQATYDYISKTLQYSSRHDIMSLRHILQSKTRECISSAQAIVHESPALPRFNTDGLERIKSVLAGFGSVILNDDPGDNRNNDCGLQTSNWVSTSCEDLKKELAQLRTTHEKEMQSLRKYLTEIKEEEKIGVYRLTPGISVDDFLLKCTRLEFSRSKYNAQYVQVNNEGQLINKAQINPPNRDQRLQNYKGTSSIFTLTSLISPQYFEVNARFRIFMVLTENKLLLEIGLTTEEEQDQDDYLFYRPKSYSIIVVQRCSIHGSCCRQVWKHGTHLHCLPIPLEQNDSTSVILHFGVVYDSAKSRIAFLDVENEKIIGKIDNIDNTVDLWPMFGVYYSSGVNVSMSLKTGRYIDMTESKKAMILQSLS